MSSVAATGSDDAAEEAVSLFASLPLPPPHAATSTNNAALTKYFFKV